MVYLQYSIKFNRNAHYKNGKNTIQSNAHKAVYISSILLIIIGILVPFTPLGTAIGLAPIALKYIFMIFGVTFLYCIVASYAKKIYIKKYKEWI